MGPLAVTAAAPAAIARAVLLGRAAIASTAAAAGLLLVEDWWRILAVVAVVAAGTVAEVSVLTRWPAVTRHPWPALATDLGVAVAVLLLSRGGMAFFCYVAGAAALGGALLGMRALPLWAAQAALGFAAAGAVLRANDPPPDVAAFIVAFPMVSVLAGIGAAAATTALQRHLDLAVDVIGAAQRSAAASERARLARELHDSVAKTLRGVSFAALALPQSLRRHPALAEQLAGTVSRGAEAAAREARQLLEGLRIDQLDLGFAETVRATAYDWSDRWRIPVRVDAAPVEPGVEVRYELVRILAEALHNVARHAGARHVDVTVRSGPGRLELRVRDDGRGFTPRDLADLQADGHLGIVGMAERARAVGGSLRVSSVPGGGTELVVVTPVGAAEAPV
ncbi:two-component sensor histidine kinase [Dactylosporangium aurantiacum]|uniref:Two-component sensor histidine kinase n=1 Tax=Dactylosporangium aurantiacum TaxID=35754 RepID=A0A9Q9IHY9_9ACTN|nr:ATP-binding protein [Dactylosporangium aurantiacum]MDG6102213.1 histidine kinase [Dactylosporangium aurantiacum]UWZ53473.1 two-component sensor histidine kinase [Dactylosporangium aurantiacum]